MGNGEKLIKHGDNNKNKTKTTGYIHLQIKCGIHKCLHAKQTDENVLKM